MKSVEEIFNETNKPQDIITILQGQKKECMSWSEIEKEFDATKHPIVADPTLRPDEKSDEKTHKRELPAKLTYPVEQIATRRMTQMAFSIPVKRVYNKTEDEGEKQFQKAIESVYDSVRINGINSRRFYAYFAACEMATIWYVVKTQESHNQYGFDCNEKIRCRSFSTMPKTFSKIPQAKIYPYFDDNDDLIVLSISYEDADGNQHFDAYTSNKKYGFTTENGQWKKEEFDIPTGKIPGAYIQRPLPVYYGVSSNRNDIEFTLSRDSDILRKNASPIIKVVGDLVGTPLVGDYATKVVRVKDGGDVGVMSPPLTTNDAKIHVDMLKQINEEILQLPDLSMENVKGLNAQSGEARKTLLADAHLKVGEESADIVEFLDREFNVIKSLLVVINPQFKKYQNTTTCDQIITPFIQNDEKSDIDNYVKASGTLVSRRTAIELAGLSADPDAEMEAIDKENAAEAERQRSTDLFEGAM